MCYQKISIFWTSQQGTRIINSTLLEWTIKKHPETNKKLLDAIQIFREKWRGKYRYNVALSEQNSQMKLSDPIKRNLFIQYLRSNWMEIHRLYITLIFAYIHIWMLYQWKLSFKDFSLKSTFSLVKSGMN